MTLILVELASERSDLLPPDFPATAIPGASRVRPNLSLIRADLPADAARKCFEGYPCRFAVGAQAIWDRFPEYRNEFRATVERFGPNGPTQIESSLRNLVGGDRLLTNSLRLPSQAMWRDLPHPGVAYEELEVDLSKVPAFAFLFDNRVRTPYSVANKQLYFCDYFSLVDLAGYQVLPAVCVLTPKELHDHTDFRELYFSVTQVSPAWPKELRRPTLPFVPDRYTCVIVVDNAAGGPEYADALVSRLMAGAAIAGGPSGKVVSKLMLGPGSCSSSNAPFFENWHRPFSDHALDDDYALPVNTPAFRDLLQVMASTTVDKFKAAKDDYRLLALDTVEDSRRSGVSVLAFAQLWMAIERLLPFRTETTAQLSLALSAFVPSNDRARQYANLKKSYGLRSDVVHGYRFRRDATIHEQINDIGALFRSLFLVSMQTVSSDQLRDKLISHVLSGVPEAISAVA